MIIIGIKSPSLTLGVDEYDLWTHGRKEDEEESIGLVVVRMEDLSRV